MNNKYITAFAPASIGNVAVGFDMLGLAIKGAGDRVSVRKMSEEGLSIKEIYDQSISEQLQFEFILCSNPGPMELDSWLNLIISLD